MWIPVHNHWRLNERHYGASQGLNKAETAAKYGEEQVKMWRRSYADPPPPLPRTTSATPATTDVTRTWRPAELPLTESLKDTVARFLPYWQQRIVPDLKAGRRVLIAAHGNSLRALVKHLDGVSDDEIVGAQHPDRHPARLRAGRRPESRSVTTTSATPKRRRRPPRPWPTSRRRSDSAPPVAARPRRHCRRPGPRRGRAGARTSTPGSGRASRRWRASARSPASARRCGSSATRTACRSCAAGAASTWPAPPGSCTRRSASSRWTC